MQLKEALMTFGGKAYPKFGNIVIMAGGAGSGKGFIKDNLLGIEGKVLDTDQLKQLVITCNAFDKKFQKEYQYSLSELDLGNPPDVSDLHEFVASQKLENRRNDALALSLLELPDDRLPNLIFDTTLKDLYKLQSISNLANELGYAKENISIVWVVTQFEVAKQQNSKRERRVPDDVLERTHFGVAQTMNYLLHRSEQLQTTVDGDVWVVFNVNGVDSEFVKSEFGGGYMDNVNYFHIKERGQAISLPAEVEDKIYNYTDNIAQNSPNYRY